MTTHNVDPNDTTQPAGSTPSDSASQDTEYIAYQSTDDSTQNTAYYDWEAARAEARRKKAAWKQQVRASKEYAREASQNGYPGAQEANGNQPNAQWQQFVPGPQPYRKGPNVAAIVWGGIVLLFGLATCVWLLMPGLFLGADVWAIILSIGFGVIGLALVIGAIITSISGARQNSKEAKAAADNSSME